MGENFKQFIAGGVGGMAAVFSGHPLGMDKNLTSHKVLSTFEPLAYTYSDLLYSYKYIIYGP